MIPARDQYVPMVVTTTRRAPTSISPPLQKQVGRRRHSRTIGGNGYGVATFMAVLFRRLALITFFATLIATYFVHASQRTSGLAVPNNLGTILVLLGGFFTTILLCAASFALTNL
jgi:heme/copper-type cytochrome/quinol oxidase subunit 3